MPKQSSMPSNIWQYDVLGRKEDAQYLQNYLVKRYSAKKEERGFVLAINAEWGYGKSFMLERWKEQVLLEGHPAVFFDAWQNDFTEDPLLAFIAEFDAGLKEYFKHIPPGDQVKKAAIAAVKRLWKPVLTVLACAAAKHLAGISAVHAKELFSDDEGDDDHDRASNSSGEKVSDFKEVKEKLKKAIDKALDEHNTIKKSIADFKEKLALLINALVSVSGVQLPLIIFVDELDRCRPDYAIELLEGIKHLFGVPGVFFVIATNIQQLGESVKAVYGAGFDGQRYLKRFFDLQYSLREPSNKQFATFLVREMVQPEIHNLVYGLEQSIAPTGDAVVSATAEEVLSFVLQKHADVFELGLRDQLQVATILEAAFLGLKEKQIHIFFLVFLAVIYQIDPVTFGKIAKASNISDETGFNQLHKKNGLGQIDVRTYDSTGKTKISSTSIISIANSYFSAMRTTTKVRRERSANAFDFPSNLLGNLKGTDNGTHFTADFANYFNSIQHAGGFAVKE